MRKIIIGVVGAFAVTMAFAGGILFAGQGQVQAPAPRAVFPSLIPAKPLYVLENSFLRWRLPASEQAYQAIDGRHLKEYVSDLVAISRRSRERGERFWGRIIGTQSDVETEQWLLEKMRQVGLSN